jgi:hypothetical protein
MSRFVATVVIEFGLLFYTRLCYWSTVTTVLMSATKECRKGDQTDLQVGFLLILFGVGYTLFHEEKPV